MDDEQIRALLASPLYLLEREASAGRSQVYHSVRENLMSGSSQVPKSTGGPVALSSSKNRSNQETFSDRKFSSGHQQVWETMNRFSDSLIQKILSNRSLRVTEILCLRKRNLKSRSKNVKWTLLTNAFVKFNDKLILIG